ncbi:TPA: restriction endonuclease subunit S [Photobacterium damselae]
MKFNLLEEYLKIPLRNGLTKPKKVRGAGYKMVNMGELFSTPIIDNLDMDRVPLSEKEKVSLLESGDLLFARQSLVREGAGQCSIFLGDEEEVCFESHIIRCRIDTKKANPLFLFYYFKSSIGKSHVDCFVEQGAGAAGIRGSDLLKVKVPNINVSVQNRMAEILFAMDKKLSNNNKTNQTLEEMVQAIFKSWFVDFDPVKAKMNGEQPEGMDAATASLFPEKLVESELGLIPEGWEAVQIGNIVERLKPKKRYTKKQVEPYGKTPVYEQGASILLGFHNDDAGFDASPEEPVFIFGDHTCITHLSCSKFDISSNVIPLKGSIRPTIWTYYAIQGKQEFQEYRRHWSEFIIKGVVLPPIELAEKYAELVTTNYLMMESLKRQSKELEQLRDTLLPKLLSGEIDLKESGAVEENDVVSRLLQQMDFGIKSKPRKGPIPNGSIGYITMSGTFGSDGGTFVDIPKAVQALTKITSADGTYGEIAGNALTESVLSGTVEIVTNNIIPLGVLTKICTAVFGKKTPIKPRDAVLLTSIHQAKNKTLDGIMNEQAKRFKFLEQSSMDEQEFGESLRYLESIGVVKCEGQHIALLDTIVQH